MSLKSVAVVAPPAKTALTTAAVAEPTQPEIAVRAHQLFEQRGGEAGHELEDWL